MTSDEWFTHLFERWLLDEKGGRVINLYKSVDWLMIPKVVIEGVGNYNTAATAIHKNIIRSPQRYARQPNQFQPSGPYDHFTNHYRICNFTEHESKATMTDKVLHVNL